MRLEPPKTLRNYPKHPLAKLYPDLSYVYALKMHRSDFVYIGSTFNVIYRLVGHNLGNTKFTRQYRPLTLYRAVGVMDRKVAYALESDLHKDSKLKSHFEKEICTDDRILFWLNKESIEFVNQVAENWVAESEKADINEMSYPELRDFLVSKDVLNLRFQLPYIGGEPIWRS